MISVSVVLLAGLVCAALLRRRSAALRHWVLAAAVACAAATPVLERVGPTWTVPGLSLPGGQRASAGRLELTDADAAAPARADVPSRRSFADLLQWVGVVWAVFAGLGLAVLASGVAWLARVASRAKAVPDGAWQGAVSEVAAHYRLARPVRVLLSDRPSLLVTWGVRRPTVVLPADAIDWPADRARIVLGHEFAHVRRGDWATQLLAECLKYVYWFNPLAWVACRRLRREGEQACDDEVLRLGVEPSEYASQLLDLARAFRARRSLLPAPAMARPSHLEWRVRAMLNERLDRARVSRRASLATAGLLVLVTVSVAGFQPVNGREAPQVVPSVTENPAALVQSASTAPRPEPAPVPAPSSRPVAAAIVAPSAAPRAEVLQSPSKMSGTVTDATGKTMGGVRLSLSSEAGGAQPELVTGPDGRYAVSVPPGEYQVAASKPGFRTYRAKLLLSAGQSVEHDLTLRLGMLAEVVVVSGDPKQVVPGADSTAPTPRQVGRPPANDPCEQADGGGCVTPPVKLTDAVPRYPRDLLAAGTSGEAVIDGIVRPDGMIGSLIVNAATAPAFADAAMEAIRLWQFSPTRLNGVPQEIQIQVTVKFAVK